MSALAAPRTSPRMISLAIASGKGGVGKTNVTVNLALGLARLGNTVAVLDADFGLGNVDVLLGLAPRLHLGHLLNGEHDIDEIAVAGPEGVRIIPASSGLCDLTALTALQWQRLGAAIDGLRATADFLLIDTASGISNNVVRLLLGADRVAVVTSPEPTAMVDAYALVKVLTQAGQGGDLGIVVNGTADQEEGEAVFGQLDTAARRFLGRQLRHYGFVARDGAVRDAVQQQCPVLAHRPESEASRCFRILASRIAGFSIHGGSGLRLVPPPARAAAMDTPTEAPQCA
jgi:flagellar biosynthesis protein FlhG